MDEEKSVKLLVLKDGGIKMEIKNLNPIEVIKICNVGINTALSKIGIVDKKKIIPPTLNETIKANQEVN